MVLKLLVDVSLGRIAEKWLMQTEYDVLTVRDRDPHMEDINILAWAVRENRVVVTMDKDFGELVFRESLPHRGVLLLRLERETGRDKVAVLNQILAGFADDLIGGYAVYQRGRLRIR